MAANEGVWVVVACAVAVGLLVWYLHQRAMSNLAAQLTHDFSHYETILRQDLPRYSFVVLYRRFPFDTTDAQYTHIKTLEQDYSQSVTDFLAAYMAAAQGDDSQSVLMAHVNRLTELLQAIYDKMAEYMPVKSDDMEAFQEFAEELYTWFEDLRRLYHSKLRYS